MSGFSSTSSMRSRWLFVSAGAVVVLALLVFVGRWERSRWISSQMRGVERIRAAIGPLDSPRLIGYRVLPGFDCLVYRRGLNPYALELCVDPAGRVVQAIDRRRGRTYYTVQAEPSASTITVDRRTVERLLRKMGALR
jgi:hypothetical protein